MALCLLALLAGCSLGCQAHQFTYQDHDPEQVWQAMRSAAESPEYENWHVNANEVTVHDDDKRIEVHRVLERELHRPNARTLQEQQTWKMAIRLIETDPPTAEFVARNWTVPVKAQWQAWQYFQTVEDLLRHPEEMDVPARRPQPESQPPTPTQPDEPAEDDDLDDLLTPGEPAGQESQ